MTGRPDGSDVWEDPAAGPTGPNGSRGRVVVLLHGHDDDPERFEHLGATLTGRGRTVVVPRGPLPTGPDRLGWFDTVDGEPDPTGVRAAVGALDDVVAGLTADGVPPDRIVVVGFSQGGAVALLWATRPPDAAPGVGAVGALAVVAGWLPHVEGLDPDLAAAAGSPVWIAHGTDDEVVPWPLGRGAARALERAGASVTFVELETDHHLEPFLEDLRAWLDSMP